VANEFVLRRPLWFLAEPEESRRSQTERTQEFPYSLRSEHSSAIWASRDSQSLDCGWVTLKFAFGAAEESAKTQLGLMEDPEVPLDAKQRISEKSNNITPFLDPAEEERFRAAVQRVEAAHRWQNAATKALNRVMSDFTIKPFDAWEPTEGPSFFISGLQQRWPDPNRPIDPHDDIATRFIYLAWSDGATPHPIQSWLGTSVAKVIRSNGRMLPFFITTTDPPADTAEELKSERGWYAIWNTEQDDDELSRQIRAHLDHSGK
jgi:hypothetical protein